MPPLLIASGGIGVGLGGVITTKEGQLELGIFGRSGHGFRIGDFFFFLWRCWIGGDSGDEEVSRRRRPSTEGMKRSVGPGWQVDS